ncbi:MAG: SPFH domain-containing protein [bacterium]|nr:SPFH domain-containing protein [bacterium]
MLFLLPLIGAAILAVAAAASAKRIDTVHRAALIRWGRRTGKEYGEGWHGFWDGVMPFIDRFEARPVTLDPLVISTRVITKDNLQISIEGSAQYRVDDVHHNMGINPATMNVGMSDAIKSELGIIAGCADGDQFKAARREIWLLINSMLRFSVAPHYRASIADPTAFDPVHGDREVEPEERLPFYRKNAQAIAAALKRETANSDDHSEIEERYGIDVVVFELAEVAFTVETMAALEKKRQAELEGDAALGAFDREMKILHQLKGEVGAERALNEASLIMGGEARGKRQIISLEGLEGVVGDVARRILKGRSDS